MDKKVIDTPLRAIRAKCLGCGGDVPEEVSKCPVKDCPLYPFRLGRNPYSKRKKKEDAND